MVRELLGGGVVHFAVVGAGDAAEGAVFGLELYVDADVVEHGPGLVQVGQEFALARGGGDAEGLERGAGYDPRANGGGEGFGLEGAERLVFPGLDVARRPVVEQDVAEDHGIGLFDCDWFADCRGCADYGAEFAFDIKPGAGAKAGDGGGWRFALPIRAADGCA